MTDSLPAELKSIYQKYFSDVKNPEFYAEKAYYFFKESNYDSAYSCMYKAITFSSQNSKYYLSLANLYLAANETRKSKETLQQCVKSDSTNAEALMKLGELFFLVKKYDSAMFYINRCIMYDENNAKAYFEKGMILKESGDTALAVETFQNVVEIDAQHYDAYIQLGLLFAAKKANIAIEYYNSALKIEPKSIEAIYAKAKFFQDAGDWKNAEVQYKNILLLNPKNQDANFNLGYVYVEMNKPDEALKYFDAAIKNDANYFKGYYGRGFCFKKMGRPNEALSEFKKCLTLSPDFQPAYEEAKEINQLKH